MSIVMGIIVVVQLRINKLGDMVSTVSLFVVGSLCSGLTPPPHSKNEFEFYSSPVGGLLQAQGRLESSGRLQSLSSSCGESMWSLNIFPVVVFLFVFVVLKNVCVWELLSYYSVMK